MALENVLSQEEDLDRVLTFDEFRGGNPPAYLGMLAYFDEKSLFRGPLTSQDYFIKFQSKHRQLRNGLTHSVTNRRGTEDPLEVLRTLEPDLYTAYKIMRDYCASNKDLRVRVNGR